ncbi:carbohydrate-binding protein [Actinomadura welshii]
MRRAGRLRRLVHQRHPGAGRDVRRFRRLHPRRHDVLPADQRTAPGVRPDPVHRRFQPPRTTRRTSGTWAPGTVYQAGDVVTYNGATYRCLQAHQAQAAWTPANVPALWQRV